MTTTEAIIAVGVLIVIAMECATTPVSRDYHTDLKNIAYQLSRIADALNRREE